MVWLPIGVAVEAYGKSNWSGGESDLCAAMLGCEGRRSRREGATPHHPAPLEDAAACSA